MTRALKVKVATSDLLEKVIAAKAAAVAKHEKDVADWERATARFQGDVISSLERALQLARDGKFPTLSSNWRGGAYRSTLEVPTKASKASKPTLNTSQFDKDIAILRIAAEETLSISADDSFGRYL